MKKVLVINGPNMNMLGRRPNDKYGSLTLSDIQALMLEEAGNAFELEFFQSNSEADIITKIQDNLSVDAIIINPAAYSHTSIAIFDALEMFANPLIEVHMSDVDKREDFRQTDYIKSIATKRFTGRKENSYVDAINYLKKSNVMV